MTQAAQCGVEHDRPELYFCDDLKGYGWCFRKGNFLNVGLGREGNHRLPEHVHAFAAGCSRKARFRPTRPRASKATRTCCIRTRSGPSSATA